MNASARRFTFPLLLATALLVVVALAPWWRNHSYLRDLYDYGLVIAANGHLDRGERPYMDFTTPIQAGFLALGWLAERAGGGTYLGLTSGAAALIVCAGLALPLMLARRWPWWAAAIVGGAVTVSAASQHTILWHNALGVVALSLATWAVAVAPVFRRADWPWHVLAATGLFLGGINKLNYQLVAVAFCLAWTVRAGVARSAGWGRALGTVAGILIIGLILPVAAELAWTGASLKLWFANVVTLPAAARTEILPQILAGHFWVRPLHNYYGPLLLPQVGLMALWIAAGAVAGCWPGRTAGRSDRFFVPLAAFGALAAGAALLATNFEIAPLGLGAWLALLVSVWLGFAPTARPVRLVAGLVVPALLLGGAAWWSAWLGQRSQFGYSSAARSDYVPATQASPAFGFLKGLYLPPEVESSLTRLVTFLPEPDVRGYYRIFYGLGTEWLDRCFPAPPQKGKPLWVHWGTSYGRAAITQLRAEFDEGDVYPLVLNTVARDEWPPEIQAVLREDYATDLLGPILWRRIFRGRDYVDRSDSLGTLGLLGGNFDSHLYHFDRLPLAFKQVAGDRVVLGRSSSAGSVLMRSPSYHARGLAVVARLPGGDAGPLRAEFKVITHGAIPENVRWGAAVDLPAGQQSIAVPFEFDGLGEMVELWVLPAEGSKGRLFAGYRQLELTNSIESPGGAPVLRAGQLADTEVTPEMAAAFFGAVAWRPQQWVVRGGAAGAQGLELAPGGETWLHTEGMTGEIRGRISCAPGTDRAPTVLVVWYKGGRLQLIQHGPVDPNQPFNFRVWTAEPGGWIGILVRADDHVPPVQVRMTDSTLKP